MVAKTCSIYSLIIGSKPTAGSETHDAKTPETANRGQTPTNSTAEKKIPTDSHIPGRSHGFMVLTLLTVSVCICWLPSKIYFSIIMFTWNVPEVFANIAIYTHPLSD